MDSSADSSADGSAPPPAGLAPGTILPACKDGSGLRAALRATLGKLRKAAAEPDAAEGIHDARKAFKEYRALLRLVDTPDATALREAAATTARLLAPARDQQTCLDALEGLCRLRLLDRGAAEGAVAALAAIPVASLGPDAARTILRDFAARAEETHRSRIDAQCAGADLERGLRKAYGKAAKVPAWDDPVRLHELRKRVVILRYQLSFLARLTGGFSRNRAKRLQHLRDVLGWHQDLETLGAGLPASLPTSIAQQVRTAIVLGQKQARKEARGLHARLFRPGAKALLHRARARLSGDAARSGGQ